MNEIVRRVLTARVYDVAIESPLDPMPRLSERLGRSVTLKREETGKLFPTTDSARTILDALLRAAGVGAGVNRTTRHGR